MWPRGWSGRPQERALYTPRAFRPSPREGGGASERRALDLREFSHDSNDPFNSGEKSHWPAFNSRKAAGKSPQSPEKLDPSEHRQLSERLSVHVHEDDTSSTETDRSTDDGPETERRSTDRQTDRHTHTQTHTHTHTHTHRQTHREGPEGPRGQTHRDRARRPGGPEVQRNTQPERGQREGPGHADARVSAVAVSRQRQRARAPCCRAPDPARLRLVGRAG